MTSSTRAHKEAKKEPFLKALADFGSIAKATRAVRISRDAIHDWRRNDPAFAAAFLLAKAAFKTKPEILSIDDAMDFFTDAIRPFVPVALWPRIHSRIQIAASERKFKAHGHAASAVPSRAPQVSVPLPSHAYERANSSAGNGTPHPSF
jgi:hypothetical protein